MKTPIRVQRKRTKGFKLPENTVCVTRGTKWGNPYKVGGTTPKLELKFNKNGFEFNEIILVKDAEHAVELFEQFLNDTFIINPMNKDYLIEQLKGKNLACFCPLDSPCHADILLKIANE